MRRRHVVAVSDSVCAGARAMTEEDIEAASVGGPTIHDGPIDLCEPDPAWPRRFDDAVGSIRDALAGRVLLLEHVGSTSVPGLPAKPIIDIVMAVADSSDESSYVPALERIGYVLRVREPDWYEHRMLRGPDADVNLHVFTDDADEINRMLTFRDRLRADPDARHRYATTKRQLAAQRWKYVQNYADAKSAVIDEIIGAPPDGR